MILNKAAIILLLIFIFSSIGLLFLYPKNAADWYVLYWGVIGSNASVLGIVYTIVALNNIRRESEIIVLATRETKQKLDDFNGVSDIAKAIKLIQEIQGYARSHKYEVGIIRLQELKITVSQLKIINSGTPEIPDLSDSIFNINKLIASMEKEIAAKSVNLKIATVNGSLETLSDLLIEIQTKIIKRN
jgi:hypothetical protein